MLPLTSRSSHSSCSVASIRVSARVPLRDAIEKHLRGAIAEATLAEVGTSTVEFVICGNELVVRPASELNLHRVRRRFALNRSASPLKPECGREPRSGDIISGRAVEQGIRF